MILTPQGLNSASLLPICIDNRHALSVCLCSDEDDEEDELELQRELEQIKRDREAAAAKKAQEERERADRDSTAAALKGNPLLNNSHDGTARVSQCSYAMQAIRSHRNALPR